ncbi:hypothetical protein GWL_16220 [Herbaspirillum sp. GW103]|nr:hypothetical protein GWL_16220 [Herbaspirillum sp. GW103]
MRDRHGVEHLVVFWKIEKVLGATNKNDFTRYNAWQHFREAHLDDRHAPAQLARVPDDVCTGKRPRCGCAPDAVHGLVLDAAPAAATVAE